MKGNPILHQYNGSCHDMINKNSTILLCITKIILLLKFVFYSDMSINKVTNWKIESLKSNDYDFMISTQEEWEGDFEASTSHSLSYKYLHHHKHYPFFGLLSLSPSPPSNPSSTAPPPSPPRSWPAPPAAPSTAPWTPSPSQTPSQTPPTSSLSRTTPNYFWK